MMTFIEKLAKKTTTPIHYIAGDDGSGNQCHWFIMCSGERYDELAKKFGKGKVDLPDYGPVVASGWGLIPSEETKQNLINNYNVNWADYKGLI